MSRRSNVLLAAMVAALLVPVDLALGVDDVSAPVGTVSVVHDDRDNGLIRLAVPATDDASGVATVEVSGDGLTWASFAYAAEVDWAVFDPGAGGDPALGNRTIRVRWTDGVGNVSAPATTTLYLGDNGALEYPRPAITGSLFTIRPIAGPGDVIPADDVCRWELRWGDTASLRDNKPNSTFGSLFVAGKPDRGFCGEWTFTLPWVPVLQFEVYFQSEHVATNDDPWAMRARFYPTLGSTDNRIRSSNLPIVQVLPNTYTMVVGKPITYTAYPIGMSLKSTDIWLVYWPDFAPPPGYSIVYKRQEGGRTLTFTPPKTGNWLVTWNGRRSDFDLNASYDPKARKPDLSPPRTTPPVQRIGGGTPGSAVPVTLTWSGSDDGWGIERYRLQRSVDGGGWDAVSLPSPASTSIAVALTSGHRYQFRVRAIDKYGNKGAWDYGPTFRPKLIGDTSGSITYREAWAIEVDATALGGGLHASSDPGASARLEFKGRDVACIAERGPGNGRARVYIDGDLVATINLEAGSETPRQVVFRKHWRSLDVHRIKVVVEGTVGHPLVTLDGFAVLR